MTNIEFAKIRHYLRKSQSQMAMLLGVSTRAIQSFEQGWRKVPTPTERQMLLLLSLKVSPISGNEPCWQKRECDLKTRRTCPTWEFRAGHICWFINGTICNGKPQESWSKKMQLCRQCEVFKKLISALISTGV